MHPAKFSKKWLLKYLVFINGKCDKAVKLLKLSAPAAASWHSTLLAEVSQLCQLDIYCTATCVIYISKFHLYMRMKK